MDVQQKIAVLLTCYNRCNKTLSCLKSLFESTLPNGYFLDIFLVDDGSTDETGKFVKQEYPEVNIIQGNGNLFWNRGMHLAWETASKTKDYDYYLWLNDDTILEGHAIIELLQCHDQAYANDKKSAIITGACKALNDNPIFTYGGRTENTIINPNGQLQKCKYINGNAVLISKEVFKKLGNLCPDYTHAMGDFDYGLRAQIAGFNCYTTRYYIAVCPINEGVPGWCDPQKSLKNRLQLLYSPKGLNITEYNIFRKKFWGYKWINFAIKAYLKAIIPNFYNKLSNPNTYVGSNLPLYIQSFKRNISNR